MGNGIKGKGIRGAAEKNEKWIKLPILFLKYLIHKWIKFPYFGLIKLEIGPSG